MAMPHPPALADLLARQCRVVRCGDATALLSPKAVRCRLDSGRWQRRHPRALVAHSGPLSVAQERWAALLHAGPGAVLGRETAAALAGLQGYEPAAIQVWVPPGRHVLPATGVHVRHAGLGPEDLHPTAQPPRTCLPRSVVDAAAASPNPDRAAALVLAAVQQRLTTPARLLAVVERLPRLPRRALLLRVLADCEGGCQALPERSFRLLLRRNGLPLPDQQVPRLDADGRRRYLDAAWQRYRLRVEIDGAAHREVRQWWADLERTNALALLDDGFRELRFPAALVESRPERVAAVVQAGLRLGGWQR